MVIVQWRVWCHLVKSLPRLQRLLRRCTVLPFYANILPYIQFIIVTTNCFVKTGPILQSIGIATFCTYGFAMTGQMLKVIGIRVCQYCQYMPNWCQYWPTRSMFTGQSVSQSVSQSEPCFVIFRPKISGKEMWSCKDCHSNLFYSWLTKE